MHYGSHFLPIKYGTSYVFLLSSFELVTVLFMLLRPGVEEVGRIAACVHRSLRSVCPPKRLEDLAGVVYYSLLNRSTVSCCLNGSVALSTGRRYSLRDVIRQLGGGRPVRCVRNRAYFCKSVFQMTPNILVPHPRARRLISLVIGRTTANAHLLSVKANDKYVTVDLTGRVPRTIIAT